MRENGRKAFPGKSGSGGNKARGWKIAGCLLLAVSLVCMAAVYVGTRNQSRAEDEYERLAGQTNGSAEPEEPFVETKPLEPSPVPVQEPSAEADPLEELGVPIPEKTVDFTDLQENTNKDIYAWIYIPDTKIDYPVLQHPTDNAHYLNYNLDGSKGYPGCIYTENYNKKDFTDPNTVMYGHKMKNGTMFAGLHKYSDSEFLEEHPYVYIYTEDGLLVYQIFAAYEAGNEHILYTYDGFKDSEVFEKYIKDIFDMRAMGSVLKEDAEVTGDSRILTMSTCISGKPNNRFLVQGVLLNGE